MNEKSKEQSNDKSNDKSNEQSKEQLKDQPREQSFLFGASNAMVGTICIPVKPSAQAVPDSPVGVILFNAGVVHRVGPHRINVRLARLLASHGIMSIRFDLSGQGDSLRGGGRLNFEEQAVADIQAAMDKLGAGTGTARYVLFGFCSGGVHSVATALVDDRVVGAILFDAYIYPTKQSQRNRYRMRIKQYGFIKAVGGWAWRKMKSLVKQSPLSELAVGAGREAYAIGAQSAQEFESTLKTLIARGVAVNMMYAGEGFEYYNYAEQFRDAFSDPVIREKVECEFFPNMDHVATGMAEQQAFMEAITRWVFKLKR